MGSAFLQRGGTGYLAVCNRRILRTERGRVRKHFGCDSPYAAENTAAPCQDRYLVASYPEGSAYDGVRHPDGAAPMVLYGMVRVAAVLERTCGLGDDGGICLL